MARANITDNHNNRLASAHPLEKTTASTRVLLHPATLLGKASIQRRLHKILVGRLLILSILLQGNGRDSITVLTPNRRTTTLSVLCLVPFSESHVLT
jgi:hypothetical protein